MVRYIADLVHIVWQEEKNCFLRVIDTSLFCWRTTSGVRKLENPKILFFDHELLSVLKQLCD